MGIQEVVNRNGRLVIPAMCAVILVAGYVIFTQLRPASSQVAGDAFYTDDDGKTWWRESGNLIPPFEKNGKQVVRAAVYECDGKPFVAFMSRMTPQAKAVFEKAAAASKAGSVPDRDELRNAAVNGWEMKRPGEKAWVAGNGAGASILSSVKCADGSEPKRVD